MSRAHSEKCRLCSKLSVDEAKLMPCWGKEVAGDDGPAARIEPQRCHVRRNRYRNRGAQNQARRQSGPVIATPDIPALAPIVVFYRRTKESPVHAIGAELRENGRRILHTEIKHCLGATESQIHDWLRTALQNFSSYHGKNVGKFLRETVEFDPSECPLCRAERN